MSYLLPDISPEKVILERLRVGVNTYVSRQAVLEAYTVDHLVDQIQFRLKSEVLAQSIDQRKKDIHVSVRAEVEVPASTWQMFKRIHAESWWLGWLVRRRPVRTETYSKSNSKSETVTFEALHIYPDANIALPADTFGQPYVVHRFK